MKQTVWAAASPKKFLGAGVYAIYYTGAFKAYRRVAEQNRSGKFELPIYVGKAVPPGARKGGFGLGTAPGPALFKRLNEHSHSISAAKNLKIEDFACRFLISDDIWIPLGESLLIENFQPLWNVLIEGFGIHTPGAGRKKQVRSKWDTLHPGRNLASDLPPNPKGTAELERMIADFFAGKTVPTISPEAAVTQDEENGE